jgi:hypothetical protein
MKKSVFGKNCIKMEVNNEWKNCGQNCRNRYNNGRVLGVNKIRRRVRVRISIRVQGRVWVRVRVGV